MTTRWGIIGCGNVTEVKSGPGFSGASGSELVAVMRRDGALAQDYAKRHHVSRWYDDADSLINDHQVDAVYVGTPPGSHCEYALRVCAAGKPCYVEKPMARNHVECRQMVDAFEAADVPLFVGYYRRRLPRFVRAKEIIDAGQLGTLTGVSAHYASSSHEATDRINLPWRLEAVHSGGGLFLDLGSHTLDILDFLLGPLRHVSGRAANLASAYDVEDSVVMHFATQLGAMGTATWNFASQVRHDSLTITGTKGQLRLATFGEEPMAFETEDGIEMIDLLNPPHVHQPLIQTIVDELAGIGTCPSTGASAARTARVMDDILHDYYQGRDDAFWLSPDRWQKRS